jgi:general stress protein CsbA
MKYLNYILILVGAGIAMYAKVDAEQNQYLLMIGIVFLMLGVYRISKLIPSKKDEDLGEDNSNED